MIKELIMSGQKDNYLLLSELLKNLTPKEILNVLKEVYDEVEKKFKECKNIPELYKIFDKGMFGVFIDQPIRCQIINYDGTRIYIYQNSVIFFNLNNPKPLFETFYNCTDETSYDCADEKILNDFKTNFLTILSLIK